MGFESFFHILRGVQRRKTNAGIGEIQNAQQIAFLRNLQKEIHQEDTLTVPLQELKVVVFDIETTGFHPEKGDGILSIGAVKMQGAEVTGESFYSLVGCNQLIPREIEELTGITKEMAEGAPVLADVFIKFMQFKEDATLVAHHAKHERAFMQHASMKLFKTAFKHRIVDTAFLFKTVEPRLTLTTLDEWCLHNELPIIGRHHALGDAKMTAQLWGMYLEKARELGCETMRDVYEKYARL